VWKRTVNGLVLTFHLAGINNQNFLMRDEQTGTFWQQISGMAVSGPLAGSHLDLVYSDELTFALWKKLAPDGMVLAPVAKYAGDYEEKNWDVRMAKARTVLNFPKTPLKSREIVLGVTAFGVSRAYPVDRILHELLIEDHLAGRLMLVVVGPDRKSIRMFNASSQPSQVVSDFYRIPDPPADPKAQLFLDSATGSAWNFDGCAISGKLKGHCLTPQPALRDYWFDWRNYNPNTTIFRH
jgi:Protein of unknown function (DUF3179)